MTDEKNVSGSVHSMIATLTPEQARRGKIVSGDEAARIIRDGDIVATGGFVGIGFAEKIAIKLLALSLEERLTYNPAENLFFVNFEGYSVQSIQAGPGDQGGSGKDPFASGKEGFYSCQL